MKNIEEILGAENFERVACPFCSSAEAERFRTIADIVKCGGCGIIYLRSRLNQSTQFALYQKYAEGESHMSPPSGKEEIVSSPLRRDGFLDELLEFVKPEGKLLDVGCGWGAFLDNARSRGFEVMGLEVTQNTIDYAKNNLGLDVSDKAITDIDCRPGTLQAITMIHSLEHLPAPKQAIDKSFELLRPGGVLCGIVPNIASFASEWLEDSWEWIDPLHHLVHFTPGSITEKLTEAGFDIKKIYTASGDFNTDTIKTILIDNSIINDAAKFNDDYEFDDYMDKLNNEGKGEEIRFFAVKPNENEIRGESLMEESKMDKSMTDNSKMDESRIENSKMDKSMMDNSKMDESRIENSKINENIMEFTVTEDSKLEEELIRYHLDKKEIGEIIINDPDCLLPEYSLNWNGVEVRRGEAKDKDDGKDNEQNNKKDSEQPKETADIPSPAMNRLKFDSDFYGGFSNKAAGGKLPDPLPSPLLLNLGCGNDVKEGYVNIDLYSDNPDVVGMDIRRLDLPDGSADTILASDVLEHFSHREVDLVLKEWARVLKPEGQIVIQCPSLRLQMKAYMDGKWDADIASYMIFGGQTNPGDYHCIGFDEQSIRKHLEKAGLEILQFRELDTPQDKGYINLNMIVRAGKIMIEDEMDEDGISKDGMIEKEIVNNETINDEIIDKEDDKDIPKLNIVWEGSQFVYHSLALINREHCANILSAKQANLTIIPYETDTFRPDGNEKYEQLRANDIRYKAKVSERITNLPYVWIRHQWPPKDEVPEGAKWIIMQPWEFSVLPKDFVEIFNKADELWTPSNYSRQAFLNSGIDFNKVQVMPNGIDPELFRPGGDRYPLDTDKKVKFLFVGGAIPRKGIDILLDAYERAFTGRDDVCLVVKDMGGESFYKGQTDEASRRYDKFNNNPKMPQLIYINDEMNEDEIASLYRACDVFVSPYRGEGFSLPTLEAMACGLPVVVTKGGATDDFVDESYGWLIESKPISIGDEVPPYKLTGEGFALDPGLGELTSILRSIYDDPSGIFSKGIIASSAARSKWTWKKATLKVLTRLDYLFGTDMAVESGEMLQDRHDATITAGLAEKYFINKQFETAYGLYKQIINDELPNIIKQHVKLRIAQIEIMNKNFDAAEEILNKIGSSNSDKINSDKINPDLIYLRTNLSVGKEDIIEALETLTPLVDSWHELKYFSTLGYSLDNLLCMTGNLLYKMGDHENAMGIYKAVLQLNGENAEACFMSGMCLKSAGADGDARTMFQWALKYDPEYVEARQELEKLES